MSSLHLYVDRKYIMSKMSHVLRAFCYWLHILDTMLEKFQNFGSDDLNTVSVPSIRLMSPLFWIRKLFHNLKREQFMYKHKTVTKQLNFSIISTKAVLNASSYLIFWHIHNRVQKTLEFRKKTHNYFAYWWWVFTHRTYQSLLLPVRHSIPTKML